ncbi:ABC transporter permease subunit [Eubacteriales bacterium OttesenSCG-928-A19]|nr:ABC transporter permease subunit [Eubacteriales bacterium OttesenSCG-928-A19]
MSVPGVQKPAPQLRPSGNFFARAWSNLGKYRAIYFLLLPGLVWYILFAVVPLFGLVLSFKSYKANLGIWRSPFVGLKNFERVFRDVNFWKSVRQTLYINVFRLIFCFPFPILLALLLNELRLRKAVRPLQVIYTLPHFLSWVIIASIFNTILSHNGMVNNVLAALGLPTAKIIGNKSAFIPLLYFTDIWRSMGWSAIVYMAAIADIDTEQYEAADIDGATRMQRLWRITLPNIFPTIVIMFILAAGNIMTAGFNQVFNFSNAAVRDVAETLDMYIYRISFQSVPDFGFSMSVTLFRSVVNLVLLLLADTGSKLLGGNGLFRISA